MELMLSIMIAFCLIALVALWIIASNEDGE